MTEHHFRSGGEVFVDGKCLADIVGMFGGFFPSRAGGRFTWVQLAKHHDVGRDFRAGVLFESVIRQTNRPKQFRARGKQFAQRRIEFVHRAARRDEHQQAARTHLFQSRREEIIVDGKLVVVPARVVDGVIAKRNIGNGEVVKSIGEFGLLKRLGANVRIGIKRLGDARGQRINFNAGDGRAAEHVFGHEADEMADAAGGFEHAPAFEAEPLGGAIHRADDGRRGVMGVEGGGAGGTMFFVRKDFRKPELLLAPVGVVHVEHLGHRAPADVFYERGFFLRRRRAFLGIELPQRFDCRDVLLKL